MPEEMYNDIVVITGCADFKYSYFCNLTPLININMKESSGIKVLVIRLSSIGDIILCSPVLRCLKKIPGKEVETHLLTRKSYLSFTSNYPYIDKVITYDKDLNKVIEELKTQDYDYVIDLHHNLRSLRVKKGLGKPSGAFNKLNIQKWLLTALKIDVLPRIHIVDRLIDTARPLGIEYDGKGLDFFIPSADEVDLSVFPFGKEYTCFVIGGTYTTKRLPNEKIVNICQKLQRPVLLLGGPEDRENGEYIASHFKQTQQVINTCGQYSLNQSASLVKQAHSVITHDTGLMHVAAAFSKPIASVWGNTVPQFGMYPFFPDDYPAENHRMFQVNGLYCRPCSKIGYNRCPLKHFRCMNNIDETELAAWINNLP